MNFYLFIIFFNQKTVLNTTWGVLDPPVGNTRLNVVRLVTSLLQTNTHIINQELIALNTLGVILVSVLKVVCNVCCVENLVLSHGFSNAQQKKKTAIKKSI